jgi:hypothetical protein
MEVTMNEQQQKPGQPGQTHQPNAQRDLAGLLGGLLGSVIGNNQASHTVSQQTGLSSALVQHSGYSEAEVAPAVVKILQSLGENAR